MKQPLDSSESLVIMVDHSNQIGTEKVLLVLGVNAAAMPDPRKALAQTASAISRSSNSNSNACSPPSRKPTSAANTTSIRYFDHTATVHHPVVLPKDATSRNSLLRAFAALVDSLSADVHQVVFKHPGLADLEVGRIDFTKTREIVARWPEGVE